ncbi:MAG: cupin domain-containing protein [Gammaproteobacteria bacterium]|nr:cupin domain-containing protein [Gammaproteobacteria bacterium]MDH3406990.1 cupin domain-containing protein [Gammaproteobacteria bacterium]MDH3562802.1 cupin domain-containing protein [Gammaproteobacteria bacterium]MDH5487557.1 cupin domain-containing protein [Gammaproteobacteria bacterium]
MHKSRYSSVESFVTKDGSIIRELMHPSVHGNMKQSLAEAIVPVGQGTQLHRHRTSEEIYHVTTGEGRMVIGDQKFAINPGDTICIPPGTAHRVDNTGPTELKILCSCSPPYSHEDTELLE